MYNEKDAAIKARIKVLEGELMGLMYKLRCLHTPPAFSNLKNTFKAQSTSSNVQNLFQAAGRLRDGLEQQIMVLRDEMAMLEQHTSYEEGYALAA